MLVCIDYYFTSDAHITFYATVLNFIYYLFSFIFFFIVVASKRCVLCVLSHVIRAALSNGLREIYIHFSTTRI